MRVELCGIEKYFARTCALRGVDLTIADGARVALIGPNGSGKTTLTRAILGLVRVDGEIRVDGRPIDRAALAARIAYVPQIAPQMAATVDEIVHTVCGLRGIRTLAVAAIAAELGLPLGTLRSRSVRALSGGMRQKLLLALALAAPVDLLVLDEPTASLDAEARARFFDRVAALPDGTTVILCSHRLDELRTLVDHVVVLEEGRPRYDGPADAYLARRMISVLELRVRTEEAPRWLAEHGFERRLGGWWSRPVTAAEKLALVPAATTALGPALVDFVVRDADRLELARAA